MTEYIWVNDTIPFVVGAISHFMVLIIAVTLHEVGHIWYFKAKGLSVKFRFRWNGIWDFGGVTEPQEEISDEEHKTALYWGIVVGFIPILMAGVIFFPMLLMALPYLAVCWADIKELDKIARKQGKSIFEDMED